MPVPFPQAGQAKVDPPDAAEARLIAGGVAAAVTPPGGLTSLQRVMIEAVTESMTGFKRPASKRGHTLARRASAMTAFSAGERGRKVEPV